LDDAKGYQAIAEAEKDAAGARPPRRTLGQRLRWPLMIGGPVLLLAVAGYFLLTGGRFETTDNAYVQSARAAISPSIDGRVIEIAVTENQPSRRARCSSGSIRPITGSRWRRPKPPWPPRASRCRAPRRSTPSGRPIWRPAQETVAYTEREAARQKALAGAGRIDPGPGRRGRPRR
jgi:membrane fusion protein (multidrug efflux system)